MKRDSDRERFRIRPVSAGLLLTLAFVLALPAFAYYGFTHHGTVGVFAALLAAAICWGAGLLALSVFAILRTPDQAVNAVGLAMLIRMAIPLLAGIFLTIGGGPLVEANVLGMIVGFYLIGLVIETLLTVRLTAAQKQEQGPEAL